MTYDVMKYDFMTYDVIKYDFITLYYLNNPVKIKRLAEIEQNVCKTFKLTILMKPSLASH